MTSLEVAQYLYKQLKLAGTTIEGACAILGNVQAESGFVPNNLEDLYNNRLNVTDAQYTANVDNNSYTNFAYDRCGYGLAQWTYPTRKQNLLNYVKSKNKSIGDLNTQVEFLIKELKQDFPGIWNQLISSHDLYNLTNTLLEKWENPQVKNITLRYKYAQNWYDTLKDLRSENNMTESQAIKKILTLAREEIGYKEKRSNSQLNDKNANAGSGNFTKYARDLDAVTNFYNGAKNGYAWCDIFVDWLFYHTFGAESAMKMLCQPAKSLGAGCLYSAGYYKSAGRWTKTPAEGHQIFFTYSAGEVSHTGIVESVTDTQVITIEGNAGDQVTRCRYNKNDSHIYGYGIPRWDQVADKEYTESPSANILMLGDVGDEVKKFQEKLIKLGYSCGPDGADGDFGDNTLKAVLQFQADYKLEVDGEVGPQTLKTLDEAIQKKNSTSFRKGDLVKIKENSTYYNSKVKVPQFILNETWIIYSVHLNRAVLNKNVDQTYSIMSPINTNNLIKVQEQ